MMQALNIKIVARADNFFLILLVILSTARVEIELEFTEGKFLLFLLVHVLF